MECLFLGFLQFLIFLGQLFFQFRDTGILLLYLNVKPHVLGGERFHFLLDLLLLGQLCIQFLDVTHDLFFCKAMERVLNTICSIFNNPSAFYELDVPAKKEMPLRQHKSRCKKLVL